jgi:hypothetical protein
MGMNHLVMVLTLTGYPDVIPTNEKYLLNGNLPKEVHFHVKRYGIK